MRKGVLLFSLLSFFLNSSFSQRTNPKIELLIPTFLGGEERNYYGTGSPSSLDVIWKHNLGKGKTEISRRLGIREWKGAGWTGQPLLIKEGTNFFLIQGAYDHHLKKINATNGKLEWQYKYDDVIKGTGTIYQTPYAADTDDEFMIFQGSRLGFGNYLDSKHIPSYRAISYLTGKELWRLDVKWDASYSRDVDASCLVLKDTIYIGLENGLFTLIDPRKENGAMINGMWQPKIIQEEALYTEQDIEDHNKNVVTESSPARLRNHVYVASGSGHVYGFNLTSKKIDWDFFIGSDMDGSVVVTSDSMLLVTVEKQYIKGKGGVFKLDPSQRPSESVIWYHATRDTSFAGWDGGVIGSCGINDRYTKNEPLAAFTAIDGYLYVVNHKSISESINLGPDSVSAYAKPNTVFRYKTGPSIATPIFSNNRLIVPSYGGLYLFAYDEQNNFVLLDKFEAEFEATPILWDDKIFLASRNGYLYCFGSK